MIRVNEVTTIRIDGARLRTVIRATSWTMRAVSELPWPRSILISWASAGSANTNPTPSTARTAPARASSLKRGVMTALPTAFLL